MTVSPPGAAGMDPSRLIAQAALAAAEHLIVVRCEGQRCRALRDLAKPEPKRDPIKQAVAATSDGIMVGTPCMGACAAATIVAVGRGNALPQGLAWHGAPLWLQCTHLPDRAATVAAWIGGAAPDPRPLPRELHLDPTLIPGWPGP